MSENVFLPSKVKGLYVLEGATGWIAYIFPAGAADLPETLSLEDSFERYDGSYLFGAGAPDLTGGDFITAFRTCLNTYYGKAQQFNKRCFFWVNPAYGKDDTAPGKALVFEKFNYWGTSENLKQDSRSQRLDINASVFMGIPPFCRITLMDNRFTISRMPTSIFTNATYGLFLLNTRQNEYMRIGKIDTRGVDIEAPMILPMTGANRGCLKFELSFPFTFKDPAYFECDHDYYPYVKSNKKQDEYTLLDTGFRYFYPGEKGSDRELSYTLFRQDVPAAFTASIDFSDIFNTRNRRRTFFAFTGKNATKEKEDTLLTTTFITNYGKQIAFKPVTATDAEGCPLAGSALLVFSQGTAGPDGQKRYCWTPEGDFELSATTALRRADARQMLLCGISGTETVSYREAAANQAGDRITFFPAKPAYASGFGNDGQTGRKPADTLLTDKYTTAWALVQKATDAADAVNYYYSQPAQAPLFEPGKNAGTLDYAAVPSADLALLDPQRSDSFPIAPSATVLPVLKTSGKRAKANGTTADIKRFETEVLNPARKQLIAGYQKASQKMVRKRKLKAAAPLINGDDCPADNLTTTPQGFLVNLNADKTAWKCMTLANNEPDATGQVQVPLRFKNIDAFNDRTGLQSAYQTNEQFLVISNPSKPGDPEVLQYYIDHFQNRINIADWPFLLDIAHQHKESNTAAAFTNILIFKFCNRSIEERIKDPGLWTDPAVFNQEKDIPKLITWIENYIATARNAIAKSGAGDGSPQDKGFRQFLNMVSNPDWQGVLALQVTLNSQTLPAEIKAIMAGIDPSGFAAHHFGIEANQIKTNADQQLDVRFKSSLFGMISYFNPLYLGYQSGAIPRPAVLSPAAGDYDFQVLDLQILFTNSQIADFHATIQLSLNTAFDEYVAAASSSGGGAIYSNSIVMKGQYDKKNGSISYTFSVLQSNTLTLLSTALDAVTITGIELSTVEDKATAKGQQDKDADPLLTTRFILSGYLKFNKTGDFDLFSYESLVFDNLMLDMQFRLQDISPADHTPRKAFDFIPGNVVFNKSSLARQGSLAKHFPIELKSLMCQYPPEDKEAARPLTPESMGFMRVEAPLPTGPVNDYWYALRFNLNLGTVGALAAKVGFDASLILAWTPGKSNNQAHMYVKMPFSGGGSGGGFSIEGVLKFAIGSVLFFNDPATQEYAMIFTEVGVSLLGKKLPPNGSTVLYLFGNPDNPAADASGSSNLAWFGAYKQNKKEEANPKKLTTRQ